MTKEDLDELGADLYREHLLDHYQNPRNKGTLMPADIRHDGDNPTCGDMVMVTVRIDPKNHIKEIRFEGKGCAISQASASILYEEVKGKPADDVLKLTNDDVEKLLGIELRPARVKCAVLGLHVLREGIKEFQAKGAPKKTLPGFGKKAA